MPMKIYNVLLKGLKSPLMCIISGLLISDSLLKVITSAFQSLDLIFETFDKGYIIVCTCSEHYMQLAKCPTGSLVNICSSASWSLPSWKDLSDFFSRGKRLASCEPVLYSCFSLALHNTPANFGLQVLEGLPL